MSDLHIRLDGFVPVGQARPRACAFRRGDGTVTARVYEPSKSAAAKDAIVLEARRCIQAQGWQCFDGEPLVLILVARFAIPASASKARRALLLGQPHAQKPDVDNVVKLALDAMTMAGAWLDDKQVTTVVARALWDEAPSLRLRVLLDSPDRSLIVVEPPGAPREAAFVRDEQAGRAPVEGLHPAQAAAMNPPDRFKMIVAGTCSRAGRASP